MLRLVVAAFVGALLVAGCGGEDDPGHTPAGQAQALFLHQLYNGQLDAAYSTLHPAYQRVVPRSRFIACTRAAGLRGLGSIEILNVYDDPVQIPGEGEQTAKAVRVRLTSSNGEAIKPFVNHEVKVGSDWRWVLNARGVSAYRAGRCPGG